MRAMDEIRKDGRLMFRTMPEGLPLWGGYVKLSSGRKGSFALSFEDDLEHVSLSILGNKAPKWDEMCEVKDIFWDDEEDVIQIHPRKSVYVDFAEALHLYRPCDGDWNRLMDLVAKGIT